jgi:Cytochrome C oxidase subunit II, transmembrane domain
MKRLLRNRNVVGKVAGITVLLLGLLLAATLCFGASANPSQAPNIFKPESTPANSIFHLSQLVLAVTGLLFLIVFSSLVYSLTKYGRRRGDDGHEPPQVDGSNQVELAWIVIPVIIVLLLFLATARVIHSIHGLSLAVPAFRGHRPNVSRRLPARGLSGPARHRAAESPHHLGEFLCFSGSSPCYSHPMDRRIWGSNVATRQLLAASIACLPLVFVPRCSIRK